MQHTQPPIIGDVDTDFKVFEPPVGQQGRYPAEMRRRTDGSMDQYIWYEPAPDEMPLRTEIVLTIDRNSGENLLHLRKVETRPFKATQWSQFVNEHLIRDYLDKAEKEFPPNK